MEDAVERVTDQDSDYFDMRDAMGRLIESGDTPWRDILTAVMVLARRSRATMIDDALASCRDVLLTAARHQDNLRKFSDQPPTGSLNYEDVRDPLR